MNIKQAWYFKSMTDASNDPRRASAPVTTISIASLISLHSVAVFLVVEGPKLDTVSK